MRLPRPFWLSLVLIGAWVLTGCGNKDPLQRKAISGKVTLDGQPVKQGSISFQPTQSGGLTSGAMIVEGKFSVPAEHGLPAGKYRVSITAAESGKGGLGPDGMPGGPTGPAPKELIPPQYNTESTLTADIGDKSAPLVFDLKSK